MSSERTPKDVARQSSVFIGVLSSVAVLVVLSVSNSLNLWAISIIVGVVLEELSYFVIYNAIEKYIDHRIQILYKTISKVWSFFFIRKQKSRRNGEIQSYMFKVHSKH